jgi:hypothetical protein
VAGTVSLDVLMERVVGVAGRLEAVQVLHLYAASIGAKMREILNVRLFTKFLARKLRGWRLSRYTCTRSKCCRRNEQVSEPTFY